MPPSSFGWGRPWLRWVGLAVGLALFAGVLASSDLRGVGALLLEFRWRFFLVFPFYAIVFGLDTWGWKYALHPDQQRKVSWLDLFRVRLAGESINYVTPAASVGGEPVKAVMLSKRYSVSMPEGMASVVVAKTTMAFSMLFFSLTGIVLALFLYPLSGLLKRWLAGVMGVLSIMMVLFVLAQFLKPFQRGSRFFSWIHRDWFASLQEKMQAWDGAIVRLYRQSPGSVVRSLTFHFLGWLAGAAEVFLIFRLLHLPISIPAAFCLEALWVLLRSGAFMIPASLGASEGFMVLVCTGLGISSVAGLAVGLIRRVREMAWMGLGLLEFSRDG